MNRRPRSALRAPGARERLMLLVLAVLTGLVAMHGPATVGLPGGSHTRPADVHAMPASAMAPDDAECVHSPHGTEGHPHHADSVCAAAGVSGPPVLPALSASAVTTAAGALAVPRVPADSLGGRAPPSLSELQLLRI
ncbi:DUF6153 family protein [Streptomyces glaucosporus]|uniref:DUF6153 family protein n=1 Tax=Streptomyces glaucosporus TaxID=284044 RepID=A0ABP5V5S1_9ACTN